VSVHFRYSCLLSANKVNISYIELISRKLDKRIRQLCDRNLAELVDECKRFREQKLRVHTVHLN
jgi:hypothetical protein